MSNELVLVTGGSGFIGAHCILQLLNAGYRVRTTSAPSSANPKSAPCSNMAASPNTIYYHPTASPSLPPTSKVTQAGPTP